MMITRVGSKRLRGFRILLLVVKSMLQSNGNVTKYAQNILTGSCLTIDINNKNDGYTGIQG